MGFNLRRCYNVNININIYEYIINNFIYNSRFVGGKMEVKNRKVLCYDIISYMSVLTGFDVTTLSDDDIITMVEKLQELSDNNLMLLHEDLISIYKDS